MELKAPIDIHGPNRQWGKHVVEIVLQMWDYRAVHTVEVGGNCIGWSVLDSAAESLLDQLAPDGGDVAVTLTAPDGRQLLDEPEGGEDEYEWLKRRIVSARIVEYLPPTLNAIRARNGASPLPDGDVPYDPDAKKVQEAAA